MSRTKRKELTKKELITFTGTDQNGNVLVETIPIHRKAGPMENKKKSISPKLCPDCEGFPMEDWHGRVWECPTCGGEGEVT